MKIYHVSDTHQMHGQLDRVITPDIGLMIHTGDCSNHIDPYNNEQEVKNFIMWYEQVPVLNKIYVGGNHDTSIEKGFVKAKDFTDAGIIYLENDYIEIGGLKIWGSPNTPRFGNWAFMKPRETLNRVWEHIPDDTDIIAVHGPPQGILDCSYDRNRNLEFCGCSALMKRVTAINPKLMLFGHIHDMKGVSNAGTRTVQGLQTIFSNGACVTDGRFDYGLTSYGNTFEL